MVMTRSMSNLAKELAALQAEQEAPPPPKAIIPVFDAPIVDNKAKRQAFLAQLAGHPAPQAQAKVHELVSTKPSGLHKVLIFLLGLVLGFAIGKLDMETHKDLLSPTNRKF